VHHVLRNALMPVITVLALHMGALLGGTVLVEYVFNYPGLSGMLVDSVNARDYPAVVGIVLVISILFVTLNLVIDLLYGALDPRVRRA
jgi:peptide/nickel transport system permease protein